MIVWLNGPRGVGKTQTAQELQARLPGSFVADPEELGGVLKKLTPPELRTGDFQDHPLWRPFVLDTLTELGKHFAGPVLVPMTLAHPKYHREIVGGLRTAGIRVEHFSLLTPLDVLLRRQRVRGDGRQSQEAQHLAECLETVQGPQFAAQLNVHGQSVPEVAEAVARQAGLHLAPRRTRLEAARARIETSLGHIRR